MNGGSESTGREMCLLWVVLGGLVVAHEGLNTLGWPCGGASSWGVATLGLMAMPDLLWSKETSSLAVLWLKATSGLAAALLLAVKLQGWPSLLLDWLQEGHNQVKLLRRVCYHSPDRTWRKKPGGKESSPCVSPCPSPSPISCGGPSISSRMSCRRKLQANWEDLFCSLSVLTLVFNWFFWLPLGMSKPVWPNPIRLSLVFSFLEQFLGPDKWKMTSPT